MSKTGTILVKRIRRSGNRKYQIFVSHATADKWIAKAICERLEAKGASTFRDDRDIDGGDDIPDTLRNALAQSQELLVLLTPCSASSKWVSLEVGAAWALQRRVVAVLCHVEVDNIPEMLKAKKAYSINDLDRYLAEVSGRAKDHVA